MSGGRGGASPISPKYNPHFLLPKAIRGTAGGNGGAGTGETSAIGVSEPSGKAELGEEDVRSLRLLLEFWSVGSGSEQETAPLLLASLEAIGGVEKDRSSLSADMPESWDETEERGIDISEVGLLL